MAHTKSRPETAGQAAGSPVSTLTVLPPPDVHATSLADVAYYRIRDSIVTLELEPGTALDERSLMSQLALGRTPVREAVKRLGDEGLVQIYARRGSVVAPVEMGDLARVSEVRVPLEALAARLAADRADAADRGAMTTLLTRLEEGATSQRELIRLDQRVHQHVHRATHNRYLQSTLTEYLTLSLRLWFLGLERVQRLDEAVDEHRGLLTAIIDRDPDAAESAARAHVVGFWNEIQHVSAH